MKPIILNGHSRQISHVQYNREGDLLFTCGADRIVNVWWSDNGERLGTLGNDYGENPSKRQADQHRSVIWHCDVTRDSLHCITGSGDATCKLWDVSNGKVLNTYQFGSSVRSVTMSMDGNLFAIAQDRQMTHYCKIFVVDKRIPCKFSDENRTGTNEAVIKSWRVSDQMLMNTKLKFGYMDETLISARDDGLIQKWDWENIQYAKSKATPDGEGVGMAVEEVRGHVKEIQDLVLNEDRTLCMTSSKDKKVKIWDAMDNFDQLTEIEHVANANSCAFNPSSRYNHIAVAGGDDAKNVTTSGGTGNFECYFYNLISQETIGNFKGHFSPVNSIAFHPNGKQLVTGSEEGNARINNLDRSYIEYKEPEMDVVKEDIDYIALQA